MRKVLLLLLCSVATLAAADGPLLLRTPTLNKTQIVFSWAGDLWSVAREGGEATRLTAGAGDETNPVFSPAGDRIAFAANYQGSPSGADVYVIPAQGGEPKRLTYHPGNDVPVGWTPDGQRILFRSTRNNYSRITRLYTVSLTGGLPEPVDLPTADSGAFSPDGTHIAYLPLTPAFYSWKRYRGGRTTPIWIANLADAHVNKIPRDNSNDFTPMWVGDKVYFLSDRNNGKFTLFSYDLRSKKIEQCIDNRGYDIKSASAGPGAIVYEQFGEIHVYDLASGKTHKVPVTISADVPALQPHFEKASKLIRDAKLSPSGTRAVFGARGEVFTVPAEKGDIRNLTNTAAVAERYPAWSPDGTRIAYFSDESGEYALHIRNQNGMGEVSKYNLGKPAMFPYSPVWSPDSKKIAFTNNRLEVLYIDLQKGAPVKIDSDYYDTPERGLNPSWSPDSQWIVYTKLLVNHYHAVCVYSLASGKNTQISDGLSDTAAAHFDAGGKYLYFLASTNAGLTTAWLDLSSVDRNVTRNVYAAVLSKNEPSPVTPQSDEEKAAAADKAGTKDENKTEEAKTPAPVHIDFDGIGQRIVALPIPARNYGGMDAGKTGILYLREQVETAGHPSNTEYRFDLKSRKTDKLLEHIDTFELSANGDKMLYAQAGKFFITASAAPPKPGEGALNLDNMEVRVDPRAEWRQIYHEVWRIERDFFYDPGLHGIQLDSAMRRYEPYLANLGSREDLNYLFTEMLGELSVGHLYVGGGDVPQSPPVKTGLLGADYKIENGRYRFARVYNGENWNPQTLAPLTQPGVNVTAGEYLLAVNGRDVRGTDNVYSFFENTAGKQVVLRVAPHSDGTGSREVTVVPVDDESGLRNLAWVEENRRKVDKMTGGRVAYVYLPDTGEAGYTNFNRYYFAQVNKEAAIIDERYNGGGLVADYFVDYMNRPLLSYWTRRWGNDFTTPQNAVYGPKVMLINESAGSGGDALPWMFRQRHLGTIIGKRTWGGLVGSFGAPELIDGGTVTAPDLAFWNPKLGQWEIENHGVPPDIEVEMDPAAVRAGHDPQIEKAVEVVMAELSKNPPRSYKHPPFPNYHK